MKKRDRTEPKIGMTMDAVGDEDDREYGEVEEEDERRRERRRWEEREGVGRREGAKMRISV